MLTMKPTLQQVILWAKEAGAIARGAFEKEHTIHMKGKLDLATEVDHACEKLLMDHIRAEFPTHAIITEETGAVRGDPDHCWYIDPLDGTLNYNHKLPIYAISIAYAHKRRLQLGVVYDPSRDECFSAERSQGAHLNAQPIHVSSITSLQQSLLTTGLPAHNQANLDRNLSLIRQLTLSSQGVRRLGSIAIALCYTACGRTDAHWDLGSTPWDLAASALIVEEAGGIITSLSGSPDYFIPPYAFIASGPGLHSSLIDLLKKPV